jgi:hypothetical protein
MPALGKVIFLPSRQFHQGKQPGFSVDDEAVITRMSSMLADELTACDKDSSARARVYFYFRFHQYSMDRWTASLLAQETTTSRQLAQRLGDAFKYVTSTVVLDSDRDDRDGYRKNLSELSDHLHTLSQLI